MKSPRPVATTLALLAAFILGLGAGYLVGIANRFGLSEQQTFRFLGTYWLNLMALAGCVLSGLTGLWVAFRPRPKRAATDWTKLTTGQTLVLTLRDHYLSLAFIAITVLLAASFVPADTIHALFSWGGSER